jgi:hypothetical protein
MSCANQNIVHQKGTTFDVWQFQIIIDDVNANLTGAVIEMQLRKEAGQPVALNLTSVGNAGITITDPTNGIFQINEQVIDIPARVYRYDIKITFSDGVVRTWVKGDFNIVNVITENNN